MSGSSRLAPLSGLCLFCGPALAEGGPLALTHSGVGLFALVIFVLAYLLVMAEEYLKLRKSKPVLIAAGIIWIAIGVVYADAGLSPLAHEGFRQNLLEYGELMLFLLVAMTYINAMEDRLLFAALRARLVRAGLSLRTLFWLTGFLAFFISPVVDNLTTALLMCTVVLNVANEDRRFINLACINIVVAANAGGAFSPFGDITTLMVWQAGKVPFGQFFALFIPGLLNFLIPALLMSLMVPRHAPRVLDEEVTLRRGAATIVLLFLLTIGTAVACHHFLQLPPVLGMMTGLGYLQFFGFYLRKTQPGVLAAGALILVVAATGEIRDGELGQPELGAEPGVVRGDLLLDTLPKQGPLHAVVASLLVFQVAGEIPPLGSVVGVGAVIGGQADGLARLGLPELIAAAPEQGAQIAGTDSSAMEDAGDHQRPLPTQFHTTLLAAYQEASAPHRGASKSAVTACSGAASKARRQPKARGLTTSISIQARP